MPIVLPLPKEAEKLKDKEKEDDKEEEGKDKEEDKGYTAKELKVKVTYTKDIPEGTILLKGARIITMKNSEVIENGDILIENNRIKAVGISGSLNVPGER